MEYIKQSFNFKIEEPTVLSLGKFDGLHRGHELLMRYMAEKKTALDGLKAVVFTFDVPPQGKLHKTRPQVLTTNAEKVKLFEGVGVDYLIECPFTEEIRCMEPEDFIRKTVKSLNVKYLVVGKDFHFGHNRRGDYQMLQSFAGFYGYEVRVVDKMQKDGRDISSTFVREEISRGNIELANELLGYEFFVEGRILHGKHMGNAVLGIPTINLLPPEEKLLPPLGVYVTVKDIADKHNLKVGDTIQAVNNPLSDDKTMDLEIVGLFEVVADKTDERNHDNESSYYEYTNNAFVSEAAMKKLLENYADVGYASADFFVSDPERLESIIHEVQKINTFNWNNFFITANDEVYQNISSALSDTGTLLTTLIVVITAVSMVLMILILSMSVRSRKRETGILLAVGIAKPVVVLQYLLEVLLIAAAAFPLAYLSSKQAAGTLGTLFGKTAEHIIVTSEHFMLVVVVGGILLVTAVLASCIPAMRLKPKTILSQME